MTKFHNSGEKEQRAQSTVPSESKSMTHQQISEAQGQIPEVVLDSYVFPILQIQVLSILLPNIFQISLAPYSSTDPTLHIKTLTSLIYTNINLSISLPACPRTDSLLHSAATIVYENQITAHTPTLA